MENSKDISHSRDGKTIYTESDWKEITYQTEDGTEKQATIRIGYESTERTMDLNVSFSLFRTLKSIYSGQTWILPTGMLS